MEYLPRVADAELRDRLESSGAVLIEGAKGCGKTELARQVCASELQVEADPNVEMLMSMDPRLLLEGATPRLIDEWQRQGRLWDYVRRAIDDRQLPGQFVLTGSATPDDSLARHPGVGRFSLLRLRPMSLWEQGYSSGTNLLSRVRSGQPVEYEPTSVSLEVLAQYIVRGGWPTTVKANDRQARNYVLDYVDLLAEADISSVARSRRDPQRIRSLLMALSRNVATEVSVATLTADVACVNGSTDRETVSRYLDALERLMVTENQPAWATALRDSATLRKAPKRHLVDPSLAAAAIGATPEKLVKEPKTLGLLFESMVIRDLRVHSSPERGKVYHYRDSTGRELDAIIQYPDGWIACEIKLGSGQIEAAADNLNKVIAKIDTQTIGQPDARLIITGLGPSHMRKDGIAVVAATSLKP